jgi:cytochrome c2
MTSSQIYLLSNLSWAIFWVVVIAFIVIKEGVLSRSSFAYQTESTEGFDSSRFWRGVTTTIAPAVVVGLVVAWPLQTVLAGVIPPSQVTAGIASAAEGGDGASQSLVARGEMVFRTKGCFGCHTVQGVSEVGTVGPELTHVASRDKIAETVTYSPENLREWLQHPHDIKPGTQMPNMNLSEQELDAIVAYLDTLK